ncbi:Protein TIC 20-IV, chloroplastic [Morella rubra]|uniref:Protein TIC 20 n=1 Tax=Morella rubra TaxID=262757 RepID=A0A6A1VAU4_9ROSI|nr:Protein TIC 20-IV, chloroplastic [Morella rubra]
MPAVAPVAAAPASSSRLLVNPPHPLLPPSVPPASVRFRYKDATLERFKKTCVAYKTLCSRTVVACRSKGMSFPYLSATSSPTLDGDPGCLWHRVPTVPRQTKSLMTIQASKDSLFGCRIPTIDEKPEWWLRILACLPYLLALQMSEIAFYVLPFLERYEFLENLYYYIPGAVRRLPWWFQFAHFYVAYLGVVQNDKWPHYLRFHVAMGFLLESALLVVVNSSNLMPLIHFQVFDGAVTKCLAIVIENVDWVIV